MKTLINFYNKLALLIVTSGVWFLQSCVVYQQPREPMVKVPDIIQMSKDGVTSKDIISKIKKSHTAYTLKADQLAKLKQQGVSDSVINFMELTHINSAIRNAQYSSYNYGWPYWGGYYGYPYYGWNYGFGGYWGPTFIYRGGGGHFGGHYR
jgi:hypothetical protein